MYTKAQMANERRQFANEQIKAAERKEKLAKDALKAGKKNIAMIMARSARRCRRLAAFYFELANKYQTI